MKIKLNRHSEPVASQPYENNITISATGRRDSREPSNGIFHNLAQRLRSDRSPTSPKATIFQRVHHPDRPPVPVLPTDIPSEDECRFFLERYLNSPIEEAASSPSFGAFIKQEVSQRRAVREQPKIAEMENQRQVQMQRTERQKVHRRPLPTSRGTVAGPSSRTTSDSVSSKAATSTPTFASTQRSVRPQGSSLYPSTAVQGAPRTLRRVPHMASESQAGSKNSSGEPVSQVAARSAASSSVRPSGRSAHGSVANDPRQQLQPSSYGQYASPRPAPKPPALIPFSDRMAALEASEKQPPVPRLSNTHETERQPQYGSYRRPSVAWSSHQASPSSFQRLSEQVESPPPTGPVRPAQPSRPDQAPVHGDSHDSAAVTAAIAAAEAQNGEELLEWDIEVIKASMGGDRKFKQRPMSAAAVKSSSSSKSSKRSKSSKSDSPQTRTSANRATATGPTSSSSSSSSSTTARMPAIACLLKCLTSVPPEVAARVGIVTVGVTAPPSAVRIEQPATRSSLHLSSGNAVGGYDEAGGEDDEIRSEHGEVLEYWPEGAYYFEDAGRKNESSGSSRDRSRRSSSVYSSSQQSQPQLQRSNERESAGKRQSWRR